MAPSLSPERVAHAQRLAAALRQIRKHIAQLRTDVQRDGQRFPDLLPVLLSDLDTNVDRLALLLTNPQVSEDLSLDGTIPLPQIKTPPKTDHRYYPDLIKAFLEHTSDMEVPHVYLLWTALSTVAAVAQRKIYMESQAYMVYPNLYVWLVGPPGARKSTAIRAGRNLLRPLREFGVHMTSDAPSIVGIMKDFNDIERKGQKDHQSLNGFIGELSTFFENSPDVMTGFLTHIYDGDPDYVKRTRIGDLEGIPFPWFNWLGATTPRWMGDNLGDTAVEGGLVARTLYIYSGHAARFDAEPEVTTEFIKRCDKLTTELAHILALGGRMVWAGGRGGEAYTYFNERYKRPTTTPKIPDTRTQGYYDRKHIHMQKVAMLISLAQRDSLEVTVDDVVRAEALLEEYVEPSMKKSFTAVGRNPYATDFERVGEQIALAESVTMQELIDTNVHQLDQVKLEMTLRSLEAAGRIVKDTTQTPFRYKPGPRRV